MESPGYGNADDAAFFNILELVSLRGETDDRRQAAPASAINSFFMMFTRYVSMKQRFFESVFATNVPDTDEARVGEELKQKVRKDKR
nr:hypothetical protein [Klebsiella pneumoniae subsp. pneumoniae]